MVTPGGEKICRASRKNARQNLSLSCKKKHVPNYFFAEQAHGKAALCRVPEKCARQSFECTTKSHFPVVTALLVEC
jgi:hypothetical protein